MDIEEKQADLIDCFVKQAQNLIGASLADVVVEATSHPSLFAFSEILSVPNVAELQGTEHSKYLDLLQLFAHGTWNDYKSNAGSLPLLSPDQVRKLKQLSVLTLAESSKVLPYDQLMQELDVSNVRELEDFLINECMYAGIVRGKLDQWRRCFEVQFAAGRDLRPTQLDGMIQTLSSWLATSDNLLLTIQEKIRWADTMGELEKKHRKEVEDRIDEVKKNLKADMDLRGNEEYSEPGVMDYEEDRGRPKRQPGPGQRPARLCREAHARGSTTGLLGLEGCVIPKVSTELFRGLVPAYIHAKLITGTLMESGLRLNGISAIVMGAPITDRRRQPLV